MGYPSLWSQVPSGGWGCGGYPSLWSQVPSRRWRWGVSQCQVPGPVHGGRGGEYLSVWSRVPLGEYPSLWFQVPSGGRGTPARTAAPPPHPLPGQDRGTTPPTAMSGVSQVLPQKGPGTRDWGTAPNPPHYAMRLNLCKMSYSAKSYKCEKYF